MLCFYCGIFLIENWLGIYCAKAKNYQTTGSFCRVLTISVLGVIRFLDYCHGKEREDK